MKQRLPFLMALFAATVSVFFSVSSYPQRSPIQALPGQPAKVPSAVPSRPTQAPTAPARFPDILSAIPPTLTQGQSGTVRLTGRHLHRDMRINLGVGITVGTLTLISESTASVPVTVSPSASPGVRTLQVQVRDRIQDSRVKVTILAAYAPPAVRAVSPPTLSQGQTASLTLTGANLQNVSAVDLGPGIQTGKPTATNAMIRVEVSVSPTASPGRREVKVVDAMDAHASSASVTVIASRAVDIAPPAPPTLADKAAPPVAAPAQPGITAASLVPNRWERGRTYQVTLKGASFPPTLQVRLGKDITVDKLSVASAATATLAVTISPKATLGPHKVQVRPGADHPWVQSQAMAVVVSEIPAGPTQGLSPKAPVPQEIAGHDDTTVLSLSPNRWHPGKTYDVTVRGAGFHTAMAVGFGNDIEVEKVTVETPFRATLTVRVGPKAMPGVRPLTFRNAQGKPWQKSNTQALVHPLARNIATTPPILFPGLSEIVFTKETIHLEKPEFGKYLMMENMVGDHGIPKANDQTRFTWKEENPGSSQWFELRILNHKGEVLLSRTVKGTPLPDRFYIPDPDFLVELFDRVRSKPSSQSVSGTGQAASLTQSAWKQAALTLGIEESSTPLTANHQYISEHLQEIDCFWEVAGFQRLMSTNAQTGQGGAQTPLSVQDVEVAISERWPMKLPAFSPTGLACGAANTQLTYGKAGDTAGGEVEDHTIYVGDRVRVFGQFSLDENPWGLLYDVDWGTMGSGLVTGTTPVKGWRFRNVFIDWGDGTYDNVYVTPTTPSSIIGPAGSESDFKPFGLLKISMEHTYLYANKFPVRVFVLPEEDVGMIGTIVQASKMPQQSQAGQQTSLQAPEGPRHIVLASIADKVVSDMPVVYGFDSLKEDALDPAFFSGFTMPGSRAFLVYCNAQIIDVKADPAATGPLYLLGIKISGFSGQESPHSSLPGSLPTTPIPTQEMPIKAIDPAPGTGGTQQTGAGAVSVQSLHPGAASAQSGVSGAVSVVHDPAQAESSAIATIPWTGTADAYASTCDEAFYAMARLTYYGLGSLILRWRVDGLLIEERKVLVGPSPIRTEVDSGGAYTGAPIQASVTFTSPSLPLDPTPIGQKRTVTVEAVLGDGERVITGWETQVQGGVVVQTPIFDQPERVESPSKTYLVRTPGPGEPCAFHFPVSGGKHFVVSGLQGRATAKNGLWSGRGTLFFSLPDGPSGMSRHFVDIPFYNWEVPDGVTVKTGIIDAKLLSKALDGLPGVKAVLRSLQGEAGIQVTATMDVEIKDTGIRLVGSAQPPKWTGLAAPLIPDSGWYSSGQTLPLTQIGWSLFQIDSQDVRIDLSRTEGTEACTMPGKSAGPRTSTKTRTKPGGTQEASGGDSGHQWVGVHLGDNARLYPYLFNLADFNLPVSGWGITDLGVCGRARFGSFSHVLGNGSIEFDGIDIRAGDNQLEATYENMRIRVPWPEIEVSGGNATLAYSQGDSHAKVDFQFDTQGLKAVEDYGGVRMTSRVKDFIRMASGWGITTNTTFEFRDGQKPFAEALVSDLFFSMDGFAYLKNNLAKQSMGLNQATDFGGAGLQLHTLQVSAHQGAQSPERLSFKMDGKITFESLSSDTITLFYALKRPLGGMLIATGPAHSPFKVGAAFPPGRPVVDAVVYPEVKAPGGGLASGPVLLASLAPVSVADASGSGVQDTFGGKVSTKMFGMNDPIEATFRYGALNGKAYWLTYASGPVNAPIFPGVLLKSVNGGLAQGFDAKVFEGDPLSAVPNQSGNMVYSAGITVTSADQGVFQMSGRLSVSPSDAVYRMYFDDVKLLGVSLAKGFFQYGNGAFHGKVWGNLSLYGGAVRVEVPQGNENDLGTVGLYFSKKQWEIYAGRHGGPYVNAHLLLLDTYGYYHLGSKVGYAMGGGISFETPRICFLKTAAGQLYAGCLVGIKISPSAHLSADFWASAGLRYWVPCGGRKGSFGLSVKVHAEAPPVRLSACATIPIPLAPDLDVCFSF